MSLHQNEYFQPLILPANQYIALDFSWIMFPKVNYCSCVEMGASLLQRRFCGAFLGQKGKMLLLQMWTVGIDFQKHRLNGKRLGNRQHNQLWTQPRLLAPRARSKEAAPYFGSPSLRCLCHAPMSCQPLQLCFHGSWVISPHHHQLLPDKQPLTWPTNRFGAAQIIEKLKVKKCVVPVILKQAVPSLTTRLVRECLCITTGGIIKDHVISM